jgi:hypothetical protein
MSIKPAPTHIPTIAERTGALVTRFLSGPPRSTVPDPGEEAERYALVQWKDSIGREAATLWAETKGRDPEALRLIELIQHVSGHVPASQVAIPADDPRARKAYAEKLGAIFESARTWR